MLLKPNHHVHWQYINQAYSPPPPTISQCPTPQASLAQAFKHGFHLFIALLKNQFLVAIPKSQSAPLPLCYEPPTPPHVINLLDASSLEAHGRFKATRPIWISPDLQVPKHTIGNIASSTQSLRFGGLVVFTIGNTLDLNTSFGLRASVASSSTHLPDCYTLSRWLMESFVWKIEAFADFRAYQIKHQTDTHEKLSSLNRLKDDGIKDKGKGKEVNAPSSSDAQSKPCTESDRLVQPDAILEEDENILIERVEILGGICAVLEPPPNQFKHHTLHDGSRMASQPAPGLLPAESIVSGTAASLRPWHGPEPLQNCPTQPQHDPPCHPRRAPPPPTAATAHLAPHEPLAATLPPLDLMELVQRAHDG
ncbi:hypothetical protein PCANC_21631 [Puccinia coronata f. sp. avenae]|uniref:Uncharacterized protein n=1 Tax=Puccinia coronata f. sp. avenae TaxID=200324 RepID=A0A2N5THK5_9BASI|nr:hypothetical protein PCANC_21631 [Puccinia coronata f. sp. avenae]